MEVEVGWGWVDLCSLVEEGRSCIRGPERYRCILAKCKVSKSFSFRGNGVSAELNFLGFYHV